MKLPVKKMAGFIIAGATLLSSCDPHTCGTTHITNEASDTVILERSGGATIVVGPAEVKEIGEDCGLARGSTPASIAGDLGPVTKNGAPCKKDIRNTDNWTTTKAGKYKFEHWFRVNDNDF